jgi:hypothetical protein
MKEVCFSELCLQWVVLNGDEERGKKTVGPRARLKKGKMCGMSFTTSAEKKRSKQGLPPLKGPERVLIY